MAKCRHCKQPASKRYGLTYFCDETCAILYLRAQREKREKKSIAEAKKRIKTRQEWLKEAQAAFNKWVRLRDAKDPCISCGRHHSGQYHAGHFRTTKAAPELRFDPDNCHKQCSVCNSHLSGNLLEYRSRLMEKIGADRVARLEGPQEPVKWTIEVLGEIKKTYSKMARELEKQLNS